MLGDVLIGEFGGEEVYYDSSTDVISCKDIKVFFRTLVLFQQSDRVRAVIDNRTTTISRTETHYKIGCLEDTVQKFNSLVNKTNQLKNK